MRTRTKEQLGKAVNRIMTAAENIAKRKYKTEGYSLENRIASVEIVRAGYGEPGYSSPSGWLALGDWNRISDAPHDGALPERLSKALEKVGVGIEWADEWCTCDDCARAFRIQPDCWDWKLSFAPFDEKTAECICLTCHAEKYADNDSDNESDDSPVSQV